MKQKKKIIFVCDGNSCRSPMAKAIFSKLIFDKHGASASDYMVDSTGLHVVLSEPTNEAKKVMQNMGVNISSYSTKQFDSNYVRDFDYIITMTNKQKNEIINQIPEAKERVHLLGEFSQNKNIGQEISDPFGGNIETYARCADKIENFIKDFINSLR